MLKRFVYCEKYGEAYKDSNYKCSGLPLNQTLIYTLGQFCNLTNRAYYSANYNCTSNRADTSIPIVYAAERQCSNN